MRQGLWGLLCVAVVWFGYACGGNLYESVADKDSEEAILEEIKIALDKEDYTYAETLLDDIDSPSENAKEDLAIYQVAVNLGKIDLTVWSLIEKLVNQTVSANNSDDIFQSIVDELLGDDLTERTTKLSVLRESIAYLQEQNLDSTKAENTACFVGMMLLGATLLDASTAVESLGEEFDRLADADSLSAACTTATAIGGYVNQLSNLTTNLTMVDAVVAVCPFLSAMGSDSAVQQLVGRLEKLTEEGDQGCETLPVSGPFAAAECLTEAISGQAVAGDGQLASCEIALNCTSRPCFE